MRDSNIPDDQIHKALDELTDSGHVGFKLQFLEGLADYYISIKRIDDAKQVILDALLLLESYPESYHRHRKRFEEIKDFWDARHRFHTSVDENDLPVFELIASAEEELINDNRLSTITLMAAALETITLAMWLGREEQIKQLAKDSDELRKELSKNKYFLPEKKWSEFNNAPKLWLKNEVLYKLQAYEQKDRVTNELIYKWVDEIRQNRNKIDHGHPLSERIRITAYYVDNLYKWYKSILQLLDRARDDINRYYSDIL
jgi:hypothetical protein